MVLRACDRCHQSKEKCSFAGHHQACSRCRRLGIVCSTSRENRRMGRRPAVKAFPHGEVQVWSVEPQQRSRLEANNGRVTTHPLGRSSTSMPPSGLREDWERKRDNGNVPAVAPERLLALPTSLRTTSDAMCIVTDVEQFTVLHMPFMLGPSFTLGFQKAVYSVLCLSAPTLTEGYLAFLGLMTGYQNSLVMHRGEPDMNKAAKGLQILRSVTILQDYDAACTLFLGQAMYVFNVLTTSTGHSIVQNSLISTKQWYQRLIQYPIMDTVTLCPILIDTVECLVHREVPIIRLTVPNRIIVDRYVGLCSPLLPHLYDICERSHALKKAVLDAKPGSHPEVHDWFADIEQAIREWKPTTPRLSTEYGRYEVLAMVTQAKVYRLAALLIIHRLRYPFGVEDETARYLANCIFSEMLLFARSTPKDSTALPVIFPLILAMFEIEGPGEEIQEKLSSFTVQSICASRLQGFVKQVRASKQSGFQGTWFDLVDTHLNVAVIP